MAVEYKTQSVNILMLGLMPFKKVWELQTRLLNAMVTEKRKTYQDASYMYKPDHHLIFCQHPPVYTLGKSGKIDHLKLSADQLKSNNFTFEKINRGGDITYHGPGQLVVYPIFDLEHFKRDLHWYIRSLEEVIIRVLAEYEILAERVEGYTGVWLKKDERLKKICAIGVHMSRWISMHGLAFNIDPDLSHFDNIIPCGIVDEDKEVTSLAKELGKEPDFEKVYELVISKFVEVFNIDIV